MNIKVLILSFNHPEITKDCVLSAKSFFRDEEIFLVHNGSETKHIANVQKAYPNIHHLIIETNQGYTGGTNFGLKHIFAIPTDWILFLTNDCLLKKMDRDEFINKQTSSFIAPKITLRKTDYVGSWGGEFNASNGQLRHLKTSTGTTNMFYVHGAAFAIHRDFWKQNGDFDESLHSYWEDVDYSMRAHKKGLLLKQSPDIEIAHKVGKTTQGNSFYTTFLFQRNRIIISRRFLKMQNSHYIRPVFEIRIKLQLIRLIFLNIRRAKIKEINYLIKLLLK